MTRNLIRALIATVALAFSTPAWQIVEAQKSVHVKGYTKKDGTYVAPHERNAPAPKTTSSGTKEKTSAPKSEPPASTTTSAGVARDANGRIERSESAKRAFMKESGHPTGWPGHVVDHIKPLACGGADVPSNMQWQTVAEGKAKDKVERKDCR